MADLDNGFCWIDEVPDKFTVASGSDNLRVLAAASGSAEPTSLFRPVFNGE